MSATTETTRTAISLEAALEAAGLGDRAAFRTIYDQSCRRLMATAISLVRRRDVAEDILQEAYLRIWTNAAGFDATRGRAMPWMARIVRNIAIDRLRAERSHDSIEDHETHLTAASAPIARALDLLTILNQLEGPKRHAVTKAWVEGHTCTELAAEMGVPLGTVKSWLRRSSALAEASLAE